MEQKIFDDYGIVILKCAEDYFLRVDSGEIASRLVEAKISIDDALQAQKNLQSAHEIIVKYDKLGCFKAV